ncbi:unnamed protein product, partial [Vitis vinifera]|uniref:Uncharacterized protein n=1 Tax=Vitis vinifera TaxID=29760 RepID=D7SS39_VITVI
MLMILINYYLIMILICNINVLCHYILMRKSILKKKNSWREFFFSYFCLYQVTRFFLYQTTFFGCFLWSFTIKAM